ncbi:hypothetical protein B0H11DRAFT_2083142 [Mycena galericulata]|nr:hypothetical protein B0H11DRAFT_2083142 [Mycena galericulata]
MDGPCTMPTADEHLMLPQSPAQMFPNATRFGIDRSQFTNILGDMNIHPPPAFQEQQGGARSPVGISHALDVSGGVYSESDTYSSQLLWRGRGFPLYVPGPQETLPQEYRQRGVTIGDVGSVTPEGIFDFLFNIYLSADNCINANYVPEGFSPLTPDYDPRDVVHHGYAAGEYVATSSVRKLPDHQPMASQPPSEDSVFHCKPPKGAVLATVDTGDFL